MSHKEPSNPFYLLAMLLGVAFTLTACAFGLLLLRSQRPEGLPAQGQSGYELMELLNHHGVTIMLVELVGLGIFTVAAIWLDHVRGEKIRAAREAQNKTPPE